MKKLIMILLSALMLIGCAETNDKQAATNDNQTSETNEGNTLPDEQVLAVANEVVDEYKDAFEELAK